MVLYYLAVYKKGQKGKKEVSEQKRKDKEKKIGSAENDKSREEEEEEEDRMEEEPEAENDVEEDEVENWWHVHRDSVPSEAPSLFTASCWALRGHSGWAAMFLHLDHKRSTMKFAQQDFTINLSWINPV